MIASGSYDRTLRLWDIRSHQSLCTLTQHKGPLLSCFPRFEGVLMGFCWLCLCTGRINALQLQGQRIVSASTDHTVKVWNAKTKQYAHRLLFPLACVLVS